MFTVVRASKMTFAGTRKRTESSRVVVGTDFEGWLNIVKMIVLEKVGPFHRFLSLSFGDENSNVLRV